LQLHLQLSPSLGIIGHGSAGFLLNQSSSTCSAALARSQRMWLQIYSSFCFQLFQPLLCSIFGSSIHRAYPFISLFSLLAASAATLAEKKIKTFVAIYLRDLRKMLLKNG